MGKKNYLAVLVVISSLGGFYLSSLWSYLLFHSLAEFFSVVIACGIFIVAINTRDFLDNNYLLYLGISYLFVGFVDTIHTLAYKGMGVFPGYDADLPTQLWIGARYLESLSLFIAPFFMHKKLKVLPLFIIYIIVVSSLLVSIFTGFFPHCFLEGYGLTLFKKVSEYIISLILVFSLIFLVRLRHEFDHRVLIMLVWSIITTIFSELAFTLYVSVYGFSNFVGHILKILSFYLIYKALIETGLKKPYALLWLKTKKSEEMLRAERDKIKQYLDIAGVILLIIGADEKIELINKKGCEVLGCKEEEIIGKNWFDSFIPASIREEMRRIFAQIISGEVIPHAYVENPVLTKEGKERLIAWHNTLIRDERGNVVASLSSGEDITEKRQIEKEREALIEKLEKALSQVKVLSGLLPICASCKKIRNDQGYWIQIETYLRDHSEAEFSHGLCPECKERLYPELTKKP